MAGDKKRKKNSRPKSDKRTKRTGPRLNNSIRKAIEALNPNPDEQLHNESEDEGNEGNLMLGHDLYEYEEEVPEEETRKNRRFDAIENLEYELPDDFKDLLRLFSKQQVQLHKQVFDNKKAEDENVLSDDEGGEDGAISGDDEFEEEDDGKHAKMLQAVTGMPSEAFDGKKRKNVVVSEAYPESEYNPSHDVLEGDGLISLQDLLEPLQQKAGYAKLRKQIERMETKAMSMQAPLPKADRERLERKAAYELSKKDITKWEPLVKKNREAPTVYFDEGTDIGFSTIGAIAAAFEPRTEFEKKMAKLLEDEKIIEAHKKDGARLLELNTTSIEDERERRNRIAKMRSLLFRHEVKQKHIKKIKSKTYHRMMKKDKLKAASMQMEMDPEAAKEQAMRQEFKRAEERLTLKHKNSSKWAKRILKRGLNVQDEGTRAAVAEQLHHHAQLTRKINSMKDSSSSDETSDDDNDSDSMASDGERASKLIAKAKEKTLKALEDEDEIPNSGVLSLPFMVRGLKKKKEAAIEEAKLALQEYEKSEKRMEDLHGAESTGTASGRMVFGAARQQAPNSNSKSKSKRIYDGGESEDEFEIKEDSDSGENGSKDQQNVSQNGSVLLNDNFETHQHSVFERFDDATVDCGPKTTYDVAIYASGSWRKMKSSNEDASIKKKQESVENGLHVKDPQEAIGDSDGDSEAEMVDGILTAGSKQLYELPSQEELIHRAFAGDDVEEDFEKDKLDILNEEVPEPEKPLFLPGWGQWTNVQKKKGLPSWMLKEHENAKKKREEALKKRKDAKLKHVIISEKIDKKAEKLYTKKLPFPFTSKEVFEQSIRVPVGPEFHPATAAGLLNQPEVVKKSGVIIKPIKYSEVNPYEKGEYQGSEQKHKNKTGKHDVKSMKKKKGKGRT